MKVAFSIWDERIAPVFDVAGLIYLVDSGDRDIVPMERHVIEPVTAVQQLAWLREHGVNVLVCGALSRPLQSLIEDAGIEVIPFVSGPFNAVLQGWVAGRLSSDTFAMPGCCGRGRGLGRGMGRGRGCGPGGKHRHRELGKELP